MNVLYLTPYLPYPQVSGAKIRVFQMLNHLGRHHRVHLVALVHPDDVRFLPRLRPFTASITPLIRHSTPSVNTTTTWADDKSFRAVLQSTLSDVVRSNRFDLVDVQHSYMMPYVRHLGHLPKVLNEHNIESEIPRGFYRLNTQDYPSGNGFTGLKCRNMLREWHELRTCERRAWRDADAVTVVSVHDKRVVKKDAPGDRFIAVIPNGVDTDYYHPTHVSNSTRDSPRIVFLGSLNYGPNVDALLHFLADMWPAILAQVPRCALQIVGRARQLDMLGLDRHENVSLAANVQDIRPILGECSVMVAPMRIGGGTSLKVLTAMAAGIPVVSTSIGCRGIEVIDGRDVLIADGQDAFVQSTVRMLRDPVLRSSVAVSARKLVERKYHWDSIVTKMDAIYESVSTR